MGDVPPTGGFTDFTGLLGCFPKRDPQIHLVLKGTFQPAQNPPFLRGLVHIHHTAPIGLLFKVKAGTVGHVFQLARHLGHFLQTMQTVYRLAKEHFRYGSLQTGLHTGNAVAYYLFAAPHT